MDLPRPSIYWDPRELQGAHYATVALGIEAVPPATEIDSLIETTSPNVLSPYETSVSVRILDLATTMTVTMQFHNTTDQVIREGYFSFPLPSAGSLTKFRFFIGEERVINGKVKPTPKAVADFSGALYNRKIAALIKQETPEIFTAALGNLPSKQKLRAEVSMVMMLKEKIPGNLSTRISSLSIPTCIAPRYGKLPQSYLQDTIPRPEVQHDLFITIEAILADEVTDVISRTHDISFEHRYGPRATQSWGLFVNGDSLSQGPSNIVVVNPKQPLSALDGDFVLDFVTKPSKGPSASYAYLERHPTLHDHHALMVTIPSNILVDTYSKNDDSELLFLVDLSGSMYNKRSSLALAIKFFLNGVPVNRRFNVWSFGSTYSSLWPQSRAKSKDTLREALNHIETEIEQDLGGTDLLPALRAIFDSRSLEKASMTTDIILMTDGEVWHEEQTIEFLNSARMHSGYCVRFFCLGIGDAVSHSLVEGIGRAGGGYSEVVPASSQTGWEDRVVLMLRAALRKHIGPVKVDVGEQTETGFRLWEDQSILKSPTETSTLSPFITNKLLMLFESTCLPMNRVIIRLTTIDSSGRERALDIEPSPFYSEEPMIHPLVARELLRDLEHDRHWLVHPSEDSLRREGERIACKWSLVSKWTCMIAVEESPPKAKHDPLAAATLDSIGPMNHTGSEEWVPDLLRPVGGPSTTSAFPRLLTSIESDSEDDIGSETETESEIESDRGDGPNTNSKNHKGDEPDNGSSGAGLGTNNSGARGGYSTASTSDNSGKSKDKSHQTSTSGNTRSQTAQTITSDISHFAQRNQPAIEQMVGDLQQVTISPCGPTKIPIGTQLNIEDLTVGRPCSIKPLLVKNEPSMPMVQTRPEPPYCDANAVTEDDLEEILNKRALIGDLIRYQSSDGSFTDMPEAERMIGLMFGDRMTAILEDVQCRISFLLPAREDRAATKQFDMALTLTIIALLKAHFASCESIWTLLVENAVRFLTNCLKDQNNCIGHDDLVRVAEEAIQGIHVTIIKRQDETPPLTDFSELEKRIAETMLSRDVSELEKRIAETMSSTDFSRHIQKHLVKGVNGDGSEVDYVLPSAVTDYWTQEKVDAILGYRLPSSEMIVSCFSHVFSILVYIDHPHEIAWFCKNAQFLDDTQLPFDTTSFPPACRWLGSFLEAQWMFIPLILTDDKIFDRVLPSQTILPVDYVKPLINQREGQDIATFWQVQIHSEANRGQPVVFKIFEGAGAEELFKAETEVHLRLRNKPSRYITKQFGSFSFEGKNKYIVVLEYAAGGSLQDFFRTTDVPVTLEDIHFLWSRILQLLLGLHVLHDLRTRDGRFLAGVHQDIQPANILVFPEDGSDYPFNVRFKLIDFGLTKIGPVPTSSGTMVTENRGSRMYIAPECFENFKENLAVETDIAPTADIWALGAVFSDVFVWSICGETGREEYRLRRQAEIVSQPHLKERKMDACFHNMLGRLKAVDDFHRWALDHKRQGDDVSPCISDLILELMLIDPRERLSAMQIKARADKKLKGLQDVSLKDYRLSTGYNSPTEPIIHSPLLGYPELPSPAPQPTSILIYTDGAWEPRTSLEQPVQRAINHLIQNGQSTSTLMLQFVQFGQDEKGTKNLRFLGDQCTKQVGSDKYDIVDTNHCDDNVFKILLGSISASSD